MSPELATKQAPASTPVRFQAPASTPVRFKDLNQLFQQIEERFQRIAERAYQLFEQNGRSDGHDLEDWLQAESEVLQPVPVEIEDSGNELIVRADVPGFKPEELEVAVDKNSVMISGRSESKKEEKEKGKIVYSEQTSNEISRIVTLPSEVLSEKATATLKDGRLMITISKAGESKKSTEKKVPVKAA